MKNLWKDAGILFLITLISGLILGFVYQITKAPIALAEEKAQREAYAEVFSQASDFVKAEGGSALDSAWQSQWADAGFGGVSVDNVLTAVDESGAHLGYVLTITSHEGYGGDITFTMGIAKDGTLNGISILSISETPGLGMNAEAVLKPQFSNKKAPSFSYTKSGAQSDSEIDAISGATVTTRAVTTAVNGGLYYFQAQLGGNSYGTE